jgi:hypothetical protein
MRAARHLSHLSGSCPGDRLYRRIGLSLHNSSIAGRIIITLDNEHNHSYKVTDLKSKYTGKWRLGDVPRASQFLLMIEKLSKALIRT